MASDNSMLDAYYNNLEQLINASYYSSNIDINVFADVNNKSYYFYIKNGNIDTLYISDNCNSGDPNTIGDFFINSFNNYDDKIKIMILWDHGTNWYEKQEKAIMFDNNPDDYISIVNGELNSIVEKVSNSINNKIDLIVFDACDMQSIEVLYEIYEYCNYSLGSEVIVPYLGMPYSKILPLINNESDIEQIGKIFCDKYFEEYSDYDSIQISLMKLNKIDKVCNNILETDYFLFESINNIEKNIPFDLYKDYVYNKSNKDYLTGIKITFPDKLEDFINLNEDYYKLKIEQDYDILKFEFPYFNSPDTFAPFAINSFSIKEKNNSNYKISFNESFDFSPIKQYKIFLLENFKTNINDFSDTNEIFNGDYYFNSNEYYSKPYSVFSRNIEINIDSINTNTLIGIKVKGNLMDSKIYFISEDNDTIQTINNISLKSWKSYYAFTNKNISILFNSENNNEYVYFDDLSIIEVDSLEIFNSYTNTYLLHKLQKGEYKIFIQSEDVFSNISLIDTIFNFNIEKNVDIYVYPNPVNNEINIINDFSGDFSLYLYSINNQLIFKQTGNITNPIKVNIEKYNLAKGLYYIILENNDNFYKTKFYKK